MESTLETSSSATSLKRKADDAFDALDDALKPRESRPSPPKRANTSIYGSLAKYGIINRPSSTSKATSTPTLTALLSRARSKKNRKPLFASQSTNPSSATPEYSPGSTDAFLQRLSTFNLSTYASKPPQIDAVAASKAGWINEGGKDRLYCAICKVGWVVAGREGLSKDAANALVEKQRQSLVDMHKEGCPWRVRQCDSLVYRIPLQSPVNLSRQIQSGATELEPIMEGITVRHPLSSNQVQAFVQTVLSVPNQITLSPTSSASPSASPPLEASQKAPTPALSASTPALLTSLFGWSLVPQPPLLPRKSSSASLTLSRSYSRASSVQSQPSSSRECTPALDGTIIATSSNAPTKSLTTSFAPANGKGKPPERSAAAVSSLTVLSRRRPLQQKDAMLHCQMCQRRIGLWAFAVPSTSIDSSSMDTRPTSPQRANTRFQRQFDLLREHRSYCPYVVKSTPLPLLPSYPPPSTSSTPRSSFSLARSGTSLSVGEQTSTSTFNLRRTTSLLSNASLLARTGSLSSGAQTSTSTTQADILVEGWRAVFNIVLRFGMSERSRARLHPQPSSNPSPTPQPHPAPESVHEHEQREEDDAMSGIIQLVEGVKQHGGKQLLSYVRSLLG